jgi:hypothetical protein
MKATLLTLLSLVLLCRAATSVTWDGPTSVEYNQPFVVLSWSASNWTYTGAFVTAESEVDNIRQGSAAIGYQTTDLRGTNPVGEVLFDPIVSSSNDVNITFNCILSADYVITVHLWGATGGIVRHVSTFIVAKTCEDPSCPTCQTAGVCGAYGLCSCPAGTGWQLPSCDYETNVTPSICPLDFISGTFRFLAPEDGGDDHHGLDWIGIYPGGGQLDPTNSPYINTFAYVMCNSPLPCERTGDMGFTSYIVNLGLLLPPTTFISWGQFYADSYSIVTQGESSS